MVTSPVGGYSGLDLVLVLCLGLAVTGYALDWFSRVLVVCKVLLMSVDGYSYVHRYDHG